MTRASHENTQNDATTTRNQTTAPETGATLAEKYDRHRILEVSSALVDSLDRRHRAKVFRSSKHDATKLAYARALSQALATHNAILRDLADDELAQRVAALEQERKL